MKQNVDKASIVRMFKNGVPSIIRSCANSSDLFICNLDEKTKNEFRNGFNIDINEELLWAHDTSSWNNKNQGVVITDNGFHFVQDNEDEDSAFFLSWNNIEKVRYKDLNFIIYLHNENEPAVLPVSVLFREAVGWQTAKNVLNNVGGIVGSFAGGLLKKTINNTVLKDDRHDAEIKNALNRLAELFTKIAMSVGYEEEKSFWDVISEMIGEHEYNEARQKMDEALDPNDPNDVMVTNWTLGQSYLSERNYLLKEKGIEIGINNACLFRFDNILEKAGYDAKEIASDAALISTCKRLEKEAVNCYEKAIQIVNADEEYNTKEKAVYISAMHHDLARVAPTIERARKYIIEGLDTESGEGFAEENYKTLTKEIANGEVPFTQKYEYKERRFMFVVNSYNNIGGCYDKEENIPWVFTLKDIPTDVKFPIGHPQANTLYIGHPLKPNVYIPFENATEQLFMDKIRELTYLAQCLGATEVKFRRVKGLDVSSSRINELNAEGAAGRKLVNVEAGAKLSSNQAETYKANETVEHVQNFNPIKAPFCPDGLVWLSADESCQAMVKSRLNGNMLNYTERISSQEATTVSSSQLVNIKGSFEYLLMKASGSREVKTDSTFSKATETEWEVSITFKSLEEFDSADAPKQIAQTQGTDELSDAEQQYKDEVAFCLEDDGKIDDQERMFLERKRTKLGISQERAQQIEAMFSTPELTEDEKSYMEFVKDFVVDGTIPNSAMRMLARERKSLNLTNERAAELESLVLNGGSNEQSAGELTADEKEFVDCLNDVIVDGMIPDSAQRMINRMKTSLNISDKRATELEQIALNKQ